MGVYFKFEEKDILWAVVTTSPRIILASGTAGWHGNVGVSSSLSLYEGVRARTDIYNGSPSGINLYPLDPVDTHSIDHVLFVSGSYPSTGSVHFVKARNTDVSNVPSAATALITSDDWYQEHFNPVANLYDYYSKYNSEYFTGSYDFYSLFFWSNFPRTGSFVSFSGSFLQTITNKFTLEVQAKPMKVTGSQDFILQNQKGRFKFYITGSTGQLAFTDGATTLTSSVALQRGLWQDCMFVADGNSGTFYINSGSAGQYPYTGTLVAPLAPASGGFLILGAELINSSSVTGVGTSSFTASFTFPINYYFGYMYDSRIWGRALTQAQISSSWNQVNTTSGTDSTFLHYARFNDGPLGHRHPYVPGSGAFDYGYQASGFHGDFHNFNISLPVAPTWQPVDNPNAIGTMTRINDEVDFFRVVHVPSMFYGRQIATGSVYMVCNAHSNKGIQRVLVDDGKGRLYVSGSMTKPVSGEDFAGLKWNKVGNVFYNEGLIVITDPSLYQFGDINLDSSQQDTLQVAFSGQEKITSKVFQCRVGAGEANGSNNPTFSSLNLDPKSQFYNKYVVKNSPPTTWISAVGIYNEDHKLVAIAKLASPIRKREKDKLLIRLRMDF